MAILKVHARTTKLAENVDLERVAALTTGFSARRSIDEAIRQIIKTVFDRSFDILIRNRSALDRCTNALLEKETLDESQLLELSKGLEKTGSGPQRR